MDQCPACGEVFQTNHNCTENCPPTVAEMVEDIAVFLRQSHTDLVEAREHDLVSYTRHLNNARIAVINLKAELGLERKDSPYYGGLPADSTDPFVDPGINRPTPEELEDDAWDDYDAMVDAAEAAVELRAEEGRPPGVPWR